MTWPGCCAVEGEQRRPDLAGAAEGDEEEKEMRSQEGGVRGNQKLQWEELGAVAEG